MDKTKIKTLGFIGVFLLLVVGAGVWVYKESSKPPSGESIEAQGQTHVTDIAGFEYNSDPPTSGNHFPVWAKPGVYDRFISDGFFIHSLEHGYIVISYDCTKKISNATDNHILSFSLGSEVSAHEGEPVEIHFPSPSPDSQNEESKPLTKMTVQPSGGISWITSSSEPEVEVPLPEEFGSDSCKKLANDLEEVAKSSRRVIVTPRINKDTLIALTAWGKIDKLDKFDKGRIIRFITAYHNKGPEKTME